MGREEFNACGAHFHTEMDLYGMQLFMSGISLVLTLVAVGVLVFAVWLIRVDCREWAERFMAVFLLGLALATGGAAYLATSQTVCMWGV